MNASQFMDKQIMDLTSSSITQPTLHVSSSPPRQSNSCVKDDDIDLVNRQQENDPRQQQQQQQSMYDMNSIISGDNAIKKEEIVASYDFQPIRPTISSSPDSSALARVWISTDYKSNSPTASTLRHYGSLDSIEPAKVVVENDRSAFDAAIVSEIDKTMKKHTDNLLHLLEGVSARLTQLEIRSRCLENSVDELKVSIGNNHGNTDGKIEQVEKVLLKLQAGFEVLKDKHEIFEAQLKLAGLQVFKADHQQSVIQNSGHMDTMQQAASAPPQSHRHLPPVTFPQSIPPVPVPPSAVPPPPIAQQSFPLPNQFPQSQITPIPQKEPYYSSLGPIQETQNPQYQITPTQQPQPSSAAPSHQPYEPAPQQQYSQPPQLSQSQTSVGHHPVETPYNSSQSYPPSLRQPSSGAPPSQQYYGVPSHILDHSINRPSSGFPAGYGSPSGPTEPYPSGGSPSQYASSPTIKPPQLFSPGISQSSGSAYPQLPTARILPHALPTASGTGGGSGSSGTGNRVPIDDVVDKVSNMGFPREHVRATVRKLTENGQAVDLNTVLDKLMNDGEVQPQRGWFGR
ncbi:DNA binding protein, putative [Ricinus communis]|uniref:DNA binding protein, putative n=1 Tax=Ricinus communis TaxID=3988 RepID=B9SF87_RICCO|nr:DNA binding protein, putative [Ricinus communis]|eukprot:XP_002524656.1 arginine-glutamic acid dipeptide repeats protein [Ricinus communis]